MQADELPNELRCSYPLQFCANRRTVGKSGKLHALCRHHREQTMRFRRSSAHSSESREAVKTPSPPPPASGEPHLLFHDIADLLDDSGGPLRIECKADELADVEALLSDCPEPRSPPGPAKHAA